MAKASDVDVGLCVYMKIDASALSRLPKLKMVVKGGIGVDNFNLADCTSYGVYACNVPDYGVEEVSIHALSLTLALERKVVFYNNRMHKGEWDEEPGYPMRRVSLRTMGMLGFGRIARNLTGYAQALGYSVIAYDPFLPDEFFEKARAKRVSLDEVFALPDVLVVMAPSTKETINVVNDANLAKARDCLLLINTARGTLVDTEAVIRALDVFPMEPPKDTAKGLYGRENVILTPHIAYRSVESFAALKRMQAETGISFLKGGEPYNVVNKEVIGKAKA
ncbi:dehydrogenase [Betaproteobacteria bacterium]|nr:dehydrogenase [Betaproteobacteria bacterium]